MFKKINKSPANCLQSKYPTFFFLGSVMLFKNYTILFLFVSHFPLQISEILNPLYAFNNSNFIEYRMLQ